MQEINWKKITLALKVRTNFIFKEGRTGNTKDLRRRNV